MSNLHNFKISLIAKIQVRINVLKSQLNNTITIGERSNLIALIDENNKFIELIQTHSVEKNTKVFNILKDTFCDFYFNEFQKEYYFDAASAGALKKIADKLAFEIKNANKEVTDQGINEAFIYILNNLKSAHVWTYNNLQINILNSKLEVIITNIKTKRGTYGTTGASPEQLAGTILKHFG